MLDDYKENRSVVHSVEGIYRTLLLLIEVPQGSILGPTLWNILYDRLLQEQMSHEVKVITLSNDVVLAARSK